MRVVLDANVLVSALLAPRGVPAQLLELWQQGRYELLVSAETLAELERVLQYPRLRSRYALPDEQVGVFLRLLPHYAVVVVPAIRLQVITSDPDDDRYLECALAGGAEVIISGDRHLLALGSFQGIEILTPGAFLALLPDLT